MEKKSVRILIDNGHGSNTAGKCAPDKSLFEYKWARAIATSLVNELARLGYKAERIVPETTDVSISERCRRVNAVCAKYGAKNCVLVSVHINASGSCGAWYNAKGFSVFVSKNASSNSKKLASYFTDLAVARKMTGNRSVPACKYWTWSWTSQDIGILKGTNCPAVLTENFFQDNREDVAYLLSDAGKRAILDLHIQSLTKYIEQL